MILDEQNIENLFNNAFNGAEQAPPESVWENIEKQLDETNVVELYKNTFENSIIEPPINVWSKIQQNLWIRDFMKFTPNQINIYYSSIAAVLVGLGLFLSADNQNSVPITTVFKSKNENGTTLKIKNNTKSIINQNSDISQIEDREQTFSESGKILSESSTKSKTKGQVLQRISSNQNIELNSEILILGDSIICAGTEHFYTLNGIASNSDINWNANLKYALIDVISKNKIGLIYSKPGAYTLEAKVSLSSGNKIISFPIKVVEAETPQIIGNTKVCEGSQAQFKIGTTSKNNGKMFSWTVSVNNYNNITSSIIVVDCKTSGYDTIRLHDMNTKTNCSMTAILPFTIFPKPDVDFKISDNGSGQIELFNASKCGDKSINCKQTVKWFVNDQTFTKNNISVEFAENGTYPAILEVQNEFNCKESLKRDIVIDLQNLFVPNAFVPGNDNGVFIPKGENIATYSIEIFDASNKKLWESTQLTDGRPAEGWDGEVDGQLMPFGTYYWKISATFKDGTKWKGVNQKGRYQTFGTFILLKK